MSKKQNKRVHAYLRIAIIFLVVSSLLAAGIFFLNINNFLAKEGEQVVYTNEIYTLRGKPTELQKTLFKELTSQLEKENRDELEIVASVVKNFVADYYTWSNKQGAYDVGGREFILSLENLNFYSTSRQYIYSEITRYLSAGLSMEDLIEVVEVSGTASYAGPYEYYDQEFVAFYMVANWTYKENDKIDLTVFPTTAEFTVIVNQEGRYEIVRFY